MGQWRSKGSRKQETRRTKPNRLVGGNPLLPVNPTRSQRMVSLFAPARSLWMWQASRLLYRKPEQTGLVLHRLLPMSHAASRGFRGL